MIEISTKKIQFKDKNEIILKNIELDSSLKCFILIDSWEKSFAEVILNKILDNILWKITKENTYRDFWIALENTNIAIKAWKKEWWNSDSLNIIVALLNEKNLLFSTIWNPSWYLIKKENEILEITEKDDSRNEFSFISSWGIENEEIVIICTDKLLHHLSKSDILDSIETNSLEDIANNLEITLIEEKLKNNIWFIVIKNSYFKDIKEDKFIHIKNKFIKALDNSIVKRIIAIYMLCKENVLKQKKWARSIILLLWIIFSFFILYSTISSIITKTGKTVVINDSKKDLEDARDYIKLASENISNSEIFSENLKKWEGLIVSLKTKKLFSTDIEKLEDDIRTIKKQFNLVETFEDKEDKLIYRWLPNWVIKIIEIKWSIYVLTTKSVIWPIINNTKKPWEYVDSELWNDTFTDINEIDWDIFLTTKLWKVVSFGKNWFFKFFDVKWQTKWEEYKNVKTYNIYLYTLSSAWNQIYKHKKFGDTFEEWIPYLTPEDSKSFNNIIDIAIDWWMYLLRKDLTVVKVFKSPKYRIEKLILNKLPKNYNIEENSPPPRIISWSNLKYVYMFLNNKIWVFKTNTPNFNWTKDLTYLWQIEWLTKIIDFNVYRDWEIYALNSNWIYKISFEVSDNKLILK